MYRREQRAGRIDQGESKKLGVKEIKLEEIPDGDSSKHTNICSKNGDKANFPQKEIVHCC